MSARFARHSALAVAALLSACAPSPETPEPTVVPPTPSASTAAGPTSTPSAEPTVEPSPSTATPTVDPSPAGTPASSAAAGTAAPPSEPPPAPTAPAPSTAGGLAPGDVATAEGWRPTARPGSPDEGFMGNDTWVHATSPEHSAYAAVALGCTEIRPYPQPVAALEGNLSDDAGNAGVGLTLEFATATDASAYFAEWLRQAEACVGTVTEKVSATDDTWVGRRNLGTVWSETVGVRGDQVRLLIVDSPDADLTGALGTT
ncbi:hypothetical protein H5392_02885 [Tessaracoccus sp. MC1865]|uniref:hypothetical protein n=1 Tax=unclassified Tessaracoccus TaxID=2635419 RepID=UPI0015FF7AD7|nr:MULTISPECIES: hypothetical protein [unclassified Tessaracoccus]MBB1482804.1 hypothetical protein [Tessaracoccus sp. MC1865]MBB1510676.1 hypothetical protein [Tessaracoccus sp. MC1756]QTO37752.1 hypothetical protein J7D54_01205 [Tessaracoccus sp. MC1865]